MEDNFIRQYIGELLKSLRTQYLIDLIKPYTRLELSFLAKVCIHFAILFSFHVSKSFALQQLNVPTEEVEELLIGLILEGKVDGRIDQVDMRLELDRKYAMYPSISEAILIYSRPSGKVWKRNATQRWKNGQLL
jgi:COP9 signalosome complex subunit 2